jgi:hypothetical protein
VPVTGCSERFQECEKAVVRLKAGSLAALVRLELRQGSFLEDEVGFKVYMYVCVVSTDS